MAAYDPLFAKSPGTHDNYPQSYWCATAGPEPANDGPVSGQIDTPVAIIGAGFTGLSCGYQLARRYGIKATVLEANRPGWGASGRTGGFARMSLGRLTAQEMIDRWGLEVARRAFDETRAALNNVRTTIREAAIDCDAIEAGHLKIAHRPSRVPVLQREALLLQQQFGYPAEFVTADELRRDHVDGPQSHGALRIPDALGVHPLKLSFGVLRAARAAGVLVRGSSPVLEWRKHGSEHILTTPAGTVRAKTVVLATNAYTPQHLHRAVRATLFPILSQIIVTRPMTAGEITASNFVTRHVMTDARNLIYYWRRLPDDRILFGGRGLIADDPALNARQSSYLLSELKAKHPGLEDITIDYSWTGWVCFTRDFLPHIYHAVDDTSVQYALGYQGSGVSMSLYAGLLLAKHIGGEPIENPIPPTTTPLVRFFGHRFLRVPQRVLYHWYKFRDESD